MELNDLLVILNRHKKWLNDEEDGARANLQGADLQGANLQGADLQGAYLQGADLRGAYLQGANLRDAYLRGAYLRGADLQGADLRDAYLRGAYLQGADLRGAYLRGANLRDAYLQGADLRGADLQGADLRGAENLPDLAWTSIVPESGSFVGWKKVNDKIVKLEIQENAKRCNATGRKCRCSAARVLEIQEIDGTKATEDSLVNTNYMPFVTYKVGEMVYPDKFDDDRWNECSNGIHFFITRKEAVAY